MQADPYIGRIIAEGQAILARRQQRRLQGLVKLGETVAAIYKMKPADVFTPKRAHANPARIVAQFLANEAGYTFEEISKVYGGDRRCASMAIQTAKRAMRIAEVAQMLQSVLHKHSEFFAPKEDKS